MAETKHLLTPRENPKLLSLVIPAYNEEEMIPHLKARLSEFFTQIPCPCEVVFINDGSSDRTYELLLDWSRSDPRIKVLSFARNFGHQIAATAGTDSASGDAVVIMDADLQDPPSVVVEMLAKYREGYHVVYGQRSSREGESLFKKFTAWGFYRFMRKFIHAKLPADTGDFRLVSRDCLLVLREMRETHRFLRGMVAWVGFAQAAVRFARPKRVAGETKYPLSKMIRFAWTAAVSFSPAPLRISLSFGFLVVALAFGYTAYAVILPLIGVETVKGWSSEVAFLGIIGGSILISVGVLGEYIGRIFEEIKGRPLYIVAEAANIEGWQGRPVTRAPESTLRHDEPPSATHRANP
jgi:polyisoprenyl-phosphate glycosyltransferase